MLKVTTKSYDSYFDTYECEFSEEGGPTFASLLPASVLPYIASKLCDETEDLPYGLVGKSFTLTRP